MVVDAIEHGCRKFLKLKVHFVLSHGISKYIKPKIGIQKIIVLYAVTLEAKKNVTHF
jgi:hypothetical protein